MDTPLQCRITRTVLVSRILRHPGMGCPTQAVAVSWFEGKIRELFSYNWCGMQIVRTSAPIASYLTRTAPYRLHGSALSRAQRSLSHSLGDHRLKFSVIC